MAKVLISLDETLLGRIDRLARSRGLTRSAYLTRLAERDLARVQGPGRSPVTRRAMARLDRLFATSPSDDSTAAIRAERDER